MKKGQFAIFMVTLLLIGGALIYLVYTDLNKDNTTIEKNNNQNAEYYEANYKPKCAEYNKKDATYVVDVDTSKYTNIADYINEQQDVRIEYFYVVTDYNNNLQQEEKTYMFSADEKTKYLNELKTRGFEFLYGGLGGAYNGVTIEYVRNNKIKYVKIGDNNLSTDDGNIYKILDNYTNTISDRSAEPSEDMSCHYYMPTKSNILQNIINNLNN